MDRVPEIFISQKIGLRQVEQGFSSFFANFLLYFSGKILAIVAMDSYGIHPIVCQSSIFDHGAHCLGHLCGRKC